MNGVQVMRGVLATASSPKRWVRVREFEEYITVRVDDVDDAHAAYLTTAQAKELADQLYELALRIDAPVPIIRRDDRGRFAA